MSDRQTGTFKRLIRWLGRSVFLKLYAAALILVIGYTTWRAMRYLVVSLVVPSEVPAQVAKLPVRMQSSTLLTHHPEWQALTATENPRMPPAHYHRITGWIQPDPVNNCTTNGCHNPLPHSENKSVRAFLNMHATSMHCGVCHMSSEGRPLDLIWYDPATGAETPPPPALRAYGKLLEEKANPGAVVQSEDDRRALAQLLNETAEKAGDVRALNQLAQHIKAVRQGRAEFRDLLDAALLALPKYFRGEYGAKLALRSETGGPLLAHPNTEEAVQRFLAAGSSLDAAERESLIEEFHTLRRSEPRLCHECHRESDSLVPFEKLGYPEPRAKQLYEPNLFQALERIMEGEPLHLPQFVLPGEDPS